MDRFPESGNLVTADVYMGTCASVCKFMFCQDPLQRKLLIQMLDWELFQHGGRERSVDYYFIPRHCIYPNDQTVTIQERQTFVRILCQPCHFLRRQVVLSTSSLVYNLFVHWNLPCQNNAGDKNQHSGREATFLNTNQPHRSQPKPPTPAALRTEP